MNLFITAKMPIITIIALASAYVVSNLIPFGVAAVVIQRLEEKEED